MSPLQSRIIRIAAELPKGDSTRRRLLALVKHGTDTSFPLDWDRITDKFDDAHRKWHGGLVEYRDVMRLIEAGARSAGPEYREVEKLAQRGIRTADQLLEQQNALQDDLYSMEGRMPRR